MSSFTGIHFYLLTTADNYEHRASLQPQPWRLCDFTVISLTYLLSASDVHVQKLDAARKRLSMVTGERARVLDLVCHDPVHHLSSKKIGNGDSRGEGSADPLGGHTPEVEGALSEALAAIRSSADLRQAAAKLLGAADEMLKSVMNAVNSGLSRKIAETNDLKVRRALLLLTRLHIL